VATIEFDEVTVAVDGSVILRDISLVIPQGDFVAVIGPSGSGKTTLVRTIAGFTDVVSGTLRFDGTDVTKVKTADRGVGMVSQDPALFSHRSVRGNVSFPLEIQREQISEINQRVDAEVRALHLEHLLARRPKELSRGEAQLVQIARAMVRIPSVLLLDEPLASLDAVLQIRMRAELKMLQEGYGVTTIMTTNDPADAVAMPTRLVVIDDGRVVQVDTPLGVRRTPATADAAVATGECWLLPATVERAHDGYWLVARGRDGGPAFKHRAWAPGLADRVGEEVTLGIRPDDVDIVATSLVRGRVERIAIGSSNVALCDVGGRRLGIRGNRGLAVGDVVNLRIDHLVIFDSSTGRAIA
jgi:ABC-type sugar transport system ATPase subunit